MVFYLWRNSIFYSTNFIQEFKTFQEKLGSKKAFNILEYLQSNKEVIIFLNDFHLLKSIEKQKNQGIARRLQKSQIYSEIPMTTFYTLTNNPLDIEASNQLLRSIIPILGFDEAKPLSYPNYLQRLQF